VWVGWDWWSGMELHATVGTGECGRPQTFDLAWEGYLQSCTLLHRRIVVERALWKWEFQWAAPRSRHPVHVS
jgi:hypothetical protein